ncbi:hypothetical protein GCM10010840_33910 [Deinococcus aerolatus]|uniref:Uncharacterized protein n=1 Tax=Deinococcus aerolatus TaxID=522487 RepID=A0ABQ2GF09_9DEIO|nr:hypothetical protein [Deinococcus aerolatus]GGL93104.1 hypothetical protein GCM10010840_33910 [Deinococcus aerolatus]
MTNPPPSSTPSKARTSLAAQILSGYPGAIALGRIIHGRPVPSREQVLALHALFGLLPQTVVLDIDTDAMQLRLTGAPADALTMPCLRQALDALLPGSPHLPWACQVLGPWTLCHRSNAESVARLEKAEVWELAPMALARVREHNLEADLNRPFFQLDLGPWAAATTSWTEAHRSLQSLACFMNSNGLLGAMHWLANDGARREQANS